MLEQLMRQIIIFSLAGGLVYLLTRWLPFDLKRPRFDDPRRAALWGLLAVLVGVAIVSGLLLAIPQGDAGDVSAEPADKETSSRVYSFQDVLSQGILALLLVGPALVFLRKQRQDWTSAGVTRRNLKNSLIVGLVIGGLMTAGAVLFGDQGPREVLAGVGLGHAFAFIGYAFVGFGEEFAFRGYLQTRLEAWLGWWPGWILASLLMALAHVAQRMAIMGLPPGEALVDSLSLFPISFWLGWIMLRTRNLVAPGVVHTFANWAGTLG